MMNAPRSPDSGPKGFAGLDDLVSDLSSDIGAPIPEAFPYRLMLAGKHRRPQPMEAGLLPDVGFLLAQSVSWSLSL